jgi:hypothetical protein
MISWSIEFEALASILNEKKNLAEALGETSKKERLSKEDQKQLRSFLFRVLPEVRILTFEEENLFPEVEKGSDEEKLNILALASLRILKEDEEEAKVDFEAALSSLRLSLPADAFERIRKAVSKEIEIGDDVKEIPDYYNSLVLGIPEFLFTLLSTTLKPDEIAKSIFALQGPATLYGIPDLQKDPDFEKNHPELDSYPLASGFSLFRPKAGSSFGELLHDNSLVLITRIAAESLDVLPSVGISPRILLWGEDNLSSLFFLSEKEKDVFGTEIVSAVKNSRRAEFLSDRVKELGLSSVRLLPTTLPLIKTYEKLASFDFVVARNASCSYGLSPMDPTSLINIEEKDLDKMVQEEMDELTEMSLFVKPEGQLVFQTFTFDRKTTADITKKFLSRNPLFELVNETTLLPRKENSIGGYYALFRRKKVEAK